MDDDWRVTVKLSEEAHASHLIRRLEAGELEHDLQDSFHDRVVVTRDGDHVFLYAASEDQAREAGRAVRALTAEHDYEVDTSLHRWHPTELEWEDADKPLPKSDAERRAEHERLVEHEREEAAERGWPEWEVRVDTPSHEDAVRLAETLTAEGIQTVRRSKYLVVGALDEDNARELAERLRGEAPAGSDIKVEGTWQAARAEAPANPFALLGGLGG